MSEWLRADDPAELHDLIGDAVDRAVARYGEGRPDRPGVVACCVSGGIDSSTVCSFLPDDIICATGWYDAPGCDEREWAALAVGDRPWIEVEITPEDFIDAATDLRIEDTLSGLRCGPGAAGQWVVARELNAYGADTILTGEGGDELFGGYARQIITAGLEPPDNYTDGYELPAGYPRTLEGALAYEWAALRQLCEVDERVAGSHGLTVATPILDPWVVAWTFSQPTDLRIGKGLLREAMADRLPAAILNRTDKRGFPVPFVAWAQEDPVRSYVEDLIGYIPDPDRPYDRQWWYDVLDA